MPCTGGTVAPSHFALEQVCIWNLYSGGGSIICISTNEIGKTLLGSESSDLIQLRKSVRTKSLPFTIVEVER